MKPQAWSLTLLILCLVMIFSSCKSGDLRTDDASHLKANPKPPADYSPAVAKQLTTKGENSRAVLSPQGQRVLFISQNREQHKNAQVYELIRATNKERRITFHNGENISVNFYPNGRKMIYSSTTDEIKENPKFIRLALDKMNQDSNNKPINDSEWAPAELYSSHLDGSQIRRLTSKPQLDGYPSFHPKTGNIVFSSLRDGSIELYTMKPNGKKVRQLTKSSGHKIDPQFSKDGSRLAWTQITYDQERSQVWVARPNARDPKAITTEDYSARSPVWHPNNEHIIFSANKDDKENFELYMAKKDGTCPQRLTYNSGNDLEPRLSADGQKIIFTSNRTGKNQIYIMDFLPPKPCAPAKQ